MALATAKDPLGQPAITQGSITRVLAIGFSAVIALLLLGGGIAIRNIMSIQRNAAGLVREQRFTRHLIEDLQEEQKTLSKIFYTVTGDPDTADPEMIGHLLDNVDTSLKAMETQAQPDGRQRARWNELLQASHAFGLEARRLLSTPDESPGLGSRDLFRLHEQVITIISTMVGQGFQRVNAAESAIERGAARFNRDSLTLLLASLLLAVVCSVFTVRVTRQLFRNMAWQESELTRVSWQMLADQESIARRFSHELHDELGQTLAALKSNLAAMRSASDHRPRLEDSVKLVDDSIRNVRQLSQLLRPMILDDFGLDAGLNWLCEGFMQRTGIEVEYSSDLHDRLPDATETHLFRIAQEALTNVARHSGATKVKVRLSAQERNIRLAIADNGRGLDGTPASGPTLGMTGMRARARAAGGVLHVIATTGEGLRLEAVVPRPDERAELSPVKQNLKETHESNSNLIS